jgi:hypothetical protein
MDTLNVSGRGPTLVAHLHDKRPLARGRHRRDVIRRTCFPHDERYIIHRRRLVVDFRPLVRKRRVLHDGSPIILLALYSIIRVFVAIWLAVWALVVWVPFEDGREFCGSEAERSPGLCTRM